MLPLNINKKAYMGTSMTLSHMTLSDLGSQGRSILEAFYLVFFLFSSVAKSSVSNVTNVAVSSDQSCHTRILQENSD